jgi:hypothetical protein
MPPKSLRNDINFEYLDEFKSEIEALKTPYSLAVSLKNVKNQYLKVLCKSILKLMHIDDNSSFLSVFIALDGQKVILFENKTSARW